MGLSTKRANPKKLCVKGHATLEEVSAMWGSRKQNGYMSNNPNLNVKVKA
jgi:hypothetical protein